MLQELSGCKMKTILCLIVICVGVYTNFNSRVLNYKYRAYNTTVLNVREYGAVGDGNTNDTPSILKAISILVQRGGVLYFPTGRYIVTTYLKIKTTVPYTITGDGLSSQILWAFGDHLFLLSNEKGEASHISISNLMITATKVNKPTSIFAIYAENMTQSFVENLIINKEDTCNLPGGIAMKGVADTNTVRDVILWGITGTGIEIGHGSEVRVFGGRIIGVSRTQGIGVHVTGNNGGVHIDSTDIIGIGVGLLLDRSSGAVSNREIFITHATFDSSGRGIAVKDDSYVSIAGLWAASCDLDQIWVDVGTNALITIAGGTIFNGGAYGCADPTTQCNGITVNSGSFMITGVEIRNNLGRGVWVPNNNVNSYTISGSRIFSNGQGVSLGGDKYIFSNNICSSNKQQNLFGGKEGLVQGNIGCQ